MAAIRWPNLCPAACHHLPSQLAQGGVEMLPLDKDPASLASSRVNQQPLPGVPAFTLRLCRRGSEDGGRGVGWGRGCCSTCSNPASQPVACKRGGHGLRQIRPAERRRGQEEGAERRAAGETQVLVWRAALIHISSFFFRIKGI